MPFRSARLPANRVSPEFHTAVEVVSVHAGAVRPVAPPPLHQLVDRRLAIAQRGLKELCQALQAGQTEDASLILANLDEDLCLLRRRLRHEAERAATGRPSRGDDVIGSRKP